MLCGGTVEFRFRLTTDLFHNRCFVQNVQHPVAGGEGILQGSAQSCQGHRGAKGAHKRQCGDQAALEAAEQRGQEQHRKVKDQNDRIGHRCVAACGALHPLLVL